jgi:flagellar hook-associated protein 1
MSSVSPGALGLFTAQRGLQAAQAGLNVVNHNLANANTPGFSRQRVELESYFPYTSGGPNGLSESLQGGSIGQGVNIKQITRLHDNYLDGQYRLENSSFGQQDTLKQALSVAEGVLNEPSDNGLSAGIQTFFNSAQAVSQQPESLPARTVFLQNAKDLLNTFQQKATSLKLERQNLVGDASVSGSISTSRLATTIADVNTKAAALADLNRQILTTGVAGSAPNDLLDKRDLLLDELSKLGNLSVTNLPSNQINVSLGGVSLVTSGTVANTLSVVANTNTGPFTSTNPDPNDVPTLIRTTASATLLNNGFTGGTIGGLLQAGGNPTNQTSFKSLQDNLNTLFTSIADAINDLQTDTHPGTGTNAGRDLTGAQATDDIFTIASGTGLAIFRASVNPVLLADPKKLAAAINDSGATTGSPVGFAGVGDGRNALLMAKLKDAVQTALGGATPTSFLNQTIAKLGVDAKSSNDRANNQNDLLTQIDQRRSSVSGVNQDEELVDLLRYQRAFEASAKMIKLFDDIIQTVINMV